jgi:DNA-binding transcriptional LysR family regulator
MMLVDVLSNRLLKDNELEICLQGPADARFMRRKRLSGTRASIAQPLIPGDQFLANGDDCHLRSPEATTTAEAMTRDAAWRIMRALKRASGRSDLGTRRSAFSLDDLQLVRAIGEAGSLTAASQSLHVDHSTAFRRLGAIEDRLSARLFKRSRSGYVPTPAGEEAIAAAVRILDEATTLEQRLAGEDLRPSGTVRVTTPDTLIDLLTPIFDLLSLAHPAISLELIVSNAFLTLTRRDADIAIRPIAEAPEYCVGRRLAGVATAPYAAPAYLDGQSGSLDLAVQRWLGFEDSLSHLRSARWFEAHVSPDRIIYRSNSLLALRAAARAGIGVAALPCYLGDRDPSLCRIGPPMREMEVSLWLLTHETMRNVVRVRAVLDFVTQHLPRERDLLEGRGYDDRWSAGSRSRQRRGCG